MKELDGKLSKIVEQASLNGPILVDKRGIPHIWIVPHHTWLACGGQLDVFVPPQHPLVPFRDVVEGLTYKETAVFERLSATRSWAIAPDVLFRALILQVIYSIDTERKLYDAVAANLVFRWFVGKQYLAEELGKRRDFEEEIPHLLQDRYVVELLEQAVRRLPSVDLSEPQEFRVNRALLRAWMSQHRTHVPNA